MVSFLSQLRIRVRVSLVAVVFAAGGCSASSDEQAAGEIVEDKGPPAELSSFSTGGSSVADEPILLGALDSEGGAGGASSTECLSVVTWGQAGRHGAVPGEDGMDAIAAWLNSASTAVASHYIEKPENIPELLESTDLLILHDLSFWEINQEEVDLVEDWVRDGGALFALSGFSEDGAEVPVTNRLVSFASMSYVGQSNAGDTANMLGECAYCLASTHRQEGWNEEHPISFEVGAVGAFQGRSVQGDGEVVAEEEGKILAMTEEVDKGRVFLFHDDWVSYRSQWNTAAPASCQENLECSDVSPPKTYQVAQFWYNAIRWLVPDQECFEISDKKIVQE